MPNVPPMIWNCLDQSDMAALVNHKLFSEQASPKRTMTAVW